MNAHFHVVRVALARHLSIPPGDVELHHRLEEDLGLDPLDLVLVVLRLEELENAEFPVTHLEGVETVGHLVEVVRSWTTLDRVVTLPPPPPPRTQSGIRALVTPDVTTPQRRFATH